MAFASIHPASAAILVIGCAVGYAVATAGMKVASNGLTAFGLALVTLGFAAAFMAEITLLRRVDLAAAYIVIMAVESLLVLGYAVWLGEGLNPRQTVGAALVIGGLAAIST